jgi:acetoin:2,6-dichlorophenolindophenol oxidoreductase subunit alpha
MKMQMNTEWRIDRWEMMTLIRRTEEAIAGMVETGEVRCPCHLCIGQEAIAVGVCAALESADTIWGGHRSHGHYLAKGGSLAGLLAEVLLKVTGCSGGRGGSMHLFAPEVGILGTVPIVAGTVPLAAGAAFAYKMRGGKNVAVSFFGDGGLEEGHVHEALNLASLYRLPLIFVCENNLYSSHLHWSERRAADNLFCAGELHSIPGERVDGNDVAAVYRSAQWAVERARRGEGPSLLECRTFRWRGHVGASYDVDVGVERRGELSAWIERDPVQSLAERLREEGVSDLAAREQVITRRIATALAAARKAAHPLTERVAEFVWQEAVCAR